MIEKEKIIHDLTVALVTSTAKSHTPQEYVSLYAELKNAVSIAYKEANPSPKAKIHSKKDLGL